jgi:D-sedoheptulose 7-phosphate isomerase
MENQEYVNQYLQETIKISQTVDQGKISAMINEFKTLQKNKGRLFILGVGGSAANASHAVNDFRKMARIETYAPTDNVSELTARINDESWESVFESWLEVSQLTSKDCLLVFSVGGGSATTSQNLVRAMQYAKKTKAKVLSIVSRNGGAAKELSDVCLLIPVVNDKHITPHAEGWQAVVWHMIVNALYV